MGLQIRLRHALGERMLDLPSRAAEQPLVIGRASGAEVPVPSVKVSSRHAVLFVHDGHWVVQDADSTHGTFVNRQRIDQPTYLQVGDVVTLGPDGAHATITVDPEGGAAGRVGYVLGDLSETLPPEYAAAAAPTTAPQAYPPPAHAYATAPPAATPAAPPYGYAPDAGVVTDPYAQPAAGAEWAGVSVTPARRRYRRAAPQSSAAGAVIGTLIAVAIVGGAGWLIYKRYTQPPVIVVQQAVPTPAPEARSPVPQPIQAPQANHMFEFGGLEKPTPPTTPPTAESVSEDPVDPPEAPTSGSVPSSESPAGSAGTMRSATKPAAEPAPQNDPAWKSVESAYHDRDPALALLQFDAYAQANPGKMARTLAEYTDAMADRIWWQRVDQLLDRRRTLVDQMAKVEKELKEETNAGYRQSTLEPERLKLRERLDRVQADLKAMDYPSDKPPPLFDEEEMRRLRKDRDAKAYDEWKIRVLRHIRRTHGQYPWANEK